MVPGHRLPAPGGVLPLQPPLPPQQTPARPARPRPDHRQPGRALRLRSLPPLHTTVTVPPEAGANLGQPLHYGSEAWQRVYFRLRNSVEGINGYARDPLYERLEDTGTRRIRGIAAQTLLPAFQPAHANRRKLTARADSIALHGNRPHRRPTRRRRTEPLGTWTPKGYATQP